MSSTMKYRLIIIFNCYTTLKKDFFFRLKSYDLKNCFTNLQTFSLKTNSETHADSDIKSVLFKLSLNSQYLKL